MAIKHLAWGTAILSGLAGYIGVTLTHNLGDKQFLWFLAPAIIFGLISVVLFKKVKYAEGLDSLRRLWGGNQENKDKVDLSNCRILFDLLAKNSKSFVIDDRTWQDLNMDQLFIELDRTLTFCGQQWLYKILRMPLFKQSQLTQRNKLIELFQDNPRIRESIQMILNKIGYEDTPGMVRLLWDPPKIWRWRYGFVYWLMHFFALVSPLAFFSSLAHGIMAVTLVFVINSLIYHWTQKKISTYFAGVQSLSRLVYGSKKINATNCQELGGIQKQLKSAIHKVASYCRIASIIGAESAYPGDPLLGTLQQYVNIYFLLEIRGFYRAIDMIQRNRQEFRTIFQLLGEIDSCLAIASYRQSLDYYCKPTLCIKTQSSQKILGIDMYHPLVENPVSNSLTIKEKGILITGSNMSGKSTFLRTIGINALLAQTIYTCTARQYQSVFVKLLTVIGRSDNIIEGKSYYLVEAQSILRIISKVDPKDEFSILAILDEMFRGTNTDERIRAGCNVLRFMVARSGLVLAATHDLELTKLLVPDFENYHFSEHVSQKGLSFDYTLKQGPSTTKNAIRLLRILGYPSEITEVDL